MFNGYKYFEAIEKHAGLLGILIGIMVSIGGLAEITPLFVAAHTVKAPAGTAPYDPLRLAGKDIYVREGCYLCHSQMIRALRAETQRYGHYSIAGESMYDRPFQWGSKRTGPDLARVGAKYSDQWHRLHLMQPRLAAPDTNMPGYPWLAAERIDAEDIAQRMRVLRLLGDPYSDADIAATAAALDGKTSMDALIAYLQGLGRTTEGAAAERSHGRRWRAVIPAVWGQIAGVMIILMLLTFCGIWIWVGMDVIGRRLTRLPDCR